MSDLNSSRYYFAYGSNMNPSRVQRRFATGIEGKSPASPMVIKIGNATLADHSLSFAGESSKWDGSTATIIPQAGAKTPGVLYLTDKAQEEVLTWFENADDHNDPSRYNTYEKIDVVVVGDDGKTYPAYTFVNTAGPAKRPPSEEYLQIIQAAHDEMVSELLIRKYTQLLLRENF